VVPAATPVLVAAEVPAAVMAAVLLQLLHDIDC
jgi:hypothetical protein